MEKKTTAISLTAVREFGVSEIMGAKLKTLPETLRTLQSTMVLRDLRRILSRTLIIPKETPKM